MDAVEVLSGGADSGGSGFQVKGRKDGTVFGAGRHGSLQKKIWIWFRGASQEARHSFVREQYSEAVIACQYNFEKLWRCLRSETLLPQINLCYP